MFDRMPDSSDLDLLNLAAQPVPGGESRTGQLTGTKALMLAVFEDGIRCYLSNSTLRAEEAECWIYSRHAQSPFSFIVVCETLGLDADAVRATLRRMKSDGARRGLRRTRNNVRIPGRVHARN